MVGGDGEECDGIWARAGDFQMQIKSVTDVTLRELAWRLDEITI